MERIQMGFKASKKTREIIRHATKEFGLSQQDTIEEIVLEWAELKQNAGSIAPVKLVTEQQEPQQAPIENTEQEEAQEVTVEPRVNTVYINIDELAQVRASSKDVFTALNKRMSELRAVLKVCDEAEITIPEYGYERLNLMTSCVDKLEKRIFGEV